jgi:hypothetical protein
MTMTPTDAFLRNAYDRVLGRGLHPLSSLSQVLHDDANVAYQVTSIA